MDALDEESPIREVFAIMPDDTLISTKGVEVPIVTVEYEE